MQQVRYDATLDVYYCKNIEVDANLFYQWAERQGLTLSGKEVRYMDGNSEAFTVEDAIWLDMHELAEVLTIDDLIEFQAQHGQQG